MNELIVHEGLDGWLFLTGGTNFVTTLYERDGGHLPDANLRRWRDAIVERRRRCAALGVAYAHLVAPEKLTIYGHKQARPLVDIDLAPAIRLKAMFDGDAGDAGWVDLVSPMRECRDEIDLYWRSDTHWTPEGCLLAYHQLCDALNLAPNPDLLARPAKTFNKIMDLGSKLDPPLWEAAREVVWTLDARRVYANEVVRILETPEYGGAIHVGCHAVFRNEQAMNDRRILLFGDSFAGAGSDLLTAQLAETVRELTFVWSANIDWSLVERLKPDMLVTEMAERYMALAPNDRFNLRLTEISQILRARHSKVKAWLRATLGDFRRRSSDDS